MSQNESQKIQVSLTVPREFYKILEEVAKSGDQSVEEYVLDQVICGLDCELQASAGLLLGFRDEQQYQDQLRVLAAGGAA